MGKRKSNTYIKLEDIVKRYAVHFFFICLSVCKVSFLSGWFKIECINRKFEVHYGHLIKR